MTFRPAASRGGWIGLVAVVAAALLELVLVSAALRSGPGPDAALLGLGALALLPPALWIGYWTWGCLSLRYQLGRDGVIIRWAAHRQVVPMDSITHVLNGRPYAAPIKGLRWPGNEVGRTYIRIDDDEQDDAPRPALVYATTLTEGQLVLVTPSVAYVISPRDRVAFVDEFRARRRLGSVQDLQQRTELMSWLRVSLLADDAAMGLLLVALAANLLMFYGLTWFFPALPPEVTTGFRYDGELGEAVAGTVLPVMSSWWLPLMGMAVVLGNGVLAGLIHRHARLGARLLLLGALLVQVTIAVSLLKMV